MPMNINDASLTAAPTVSMSCISKAEIQLSVSSGAINSNALLSPGHALYNIQGQKWQQVFDFEKVLKQLRTAEKNFFRSKGVDKNAMHISASNTGGTTQRPVVIQVQRLNSQDMQFFDLAPKQTARDIVICSSCYGYCTKMGLNNHMMMQHPNIWNSISSKLNTGYAHETHNSVVENKHDGSRNIDALKEASSLEVSNTVSTSNLNAPVLSLPYKTSFKTTTASPISSSNTLSGTSSSRHKGMAKSSSSKGGNNSGSTVNRSRSKTKSQHQSTLNSLPTNTTVEGSSLVPSYHKCGAIGSNSKKTTNSSTSVATSATAPHTLIGQNDAGDSYSYSNVSTTLPITVYSSSSSNSSCSLPTTPKMVVVQDTSNVVVALPGVLMDSSVDSYVPVSSVSSQSDIKNKQANGHTSISATKNKVKSATVTSGRELIDSTTSSSSSNSEFENSAHKQKSHYVKATNQSVNITKKQPYEIQLSELDQAVSSITSEAINETKVSQIHDSMRSTAYMQQSTLSSGTDEHIQQNASDENSISLTLDDMLDSKFINEILNTAESEIPFDESVLDPAVQQTTSGNITYIQQPNCKRMRYDESVLQTQSVNNNISSELGTVEDFTTVYQHQYNLNQLENIKLYHQENAVTGEIVQGHPQLNAIDAIHLQQLIYQQQQMLEAEHKQISGDTNDFTALTYEPNEQMPANATTASQQFSVYNVPSLTDDNVAPTQLEEMMLPTSIIYEISGNNQVSALDQQSQQQVLAEFLTHAGYDNVEQMNTLTDSAIYDPSAAWAEFNELCDIDLTKLETVTTLTSTTSSNLTTTTSIMSEKKTVELTKNQETCQSYRRLTHTKHHEDFYINMFLYSGIPRPLAMNTFGMIKLSQNTATTFKKHVLATRKANNSLLSLNGNNVCGINGVMGSNGSALRFPLHHTGITKQNYYGTTSPTTSVSANEFSIGSITITNATNSNGCGTIGLTNQTSSGRTKIAPTILSAATQITRCSTTNGTSSNAVNMLNNKTIHVYNSNTISNDQIRCMKRALVSKIDYKNGVFTAKKLSELLNCKVLKVKETEKNPQQPQDQFQIQEQPEKNELSLKEPILEETKKNRMQSFYEKRRKLLNMSKGLYAQTEHAQNHHHILRPNSMLSSPLQYTQKQRQEKLLKKQLIRTLTDCGINQWKSNSNSPNGGGSSNGTANVTGNDMMRVFV